MKKLFALILAAILLCAAWPALAEGGTVIAVNATINGETSVTIEGPTTLTAVAALADGEQLDHWELNGTVVENEINPWIVFSADGDTVIMAVKRGDDQPAPAAPAPAAEEADAEKTVTAVGCTLQYLDAKGNGAGQSYESLRFDQPYVNPVTGETVSDGSISFKVTATIPKGKKVDYWVIDGIHYDFEDKIKTIVFEDLKDSMTVEVVLAKGSSATMWTTGMPTGDAPLVVSVINGELKFMKNASKSGGAAFTKLDFTNTYKNTATGKNAPGGSVSVKVKATAPSGKSVAGWLFNDVKLTFPTEITYFFAKNIHQTMEYEPIFGARYVTVKCTGCTFSGGGYTNATSGKVKAGTKITVTSTYYMVDYYTINGAKGHNGQKSFSMTVNKNTTIQCISVVN